MVRKGGIGHREHREHRESTQRDKVKSGNILVLQQQHVGIYGQLNTNYERAAQTINSAVHHSGREYKYCLYSNINTKRSVDFRPE